MPARPRPKMIVVPKPGALDKAIAKAGITGYRLAKEVAAIYGRPKASTIQNLFRHDPGEYGISVEFAERVCNVLGQPVEAIFAHPDGSQLK